MIFETTREKTMHRDVYEKLQTGYFVVEENATRLVNTKERQQNFVGLM